MSIYEKEFYRKGLAGDNYVAWTICIDSATGALTVESARTSQTAYRHDRTYTPEQFRAKGDRKAKRVFENELRRLLIGFSARRAAP